MTGSARPVYRHTDLDRVLNPASIAIVGASARAGSFGERLQNNLRGQYTGSLAGSDAAVDALIAVRPPYPSNSTVVDSAHGAIRGTAPSHFGD